MSDDVIVFELTPDESIAAAQSTLAASGYTLAQLTDMARTGWWESPRALLTWHAVGDIL